MVKPTDEELDGLSSGGARPVERYWDGSIKFSEAQNKLSIALWLDHGYTTKQTERMVLALDRVPDHIIEMVAEDITESETRPDRKPTFREVAEKCWMAWESDKDLQQFCRERQLRYRTESGD